MNNKVIVTEFFERRAKKFLKKFKSLSSELSELEKELLENPKKGIYLGSDLYKIRLASKSKGKGKSDGFRIITYLLETTETAYKINLITIYDKSEDSSITKSKLVKLIKDNLE